MLLASRLRTADVAAVRSAATPRGRLRGYRPERARPGLESWSPTSGSREPAPIARRHARVATIEQCMQALSGILGDLTDNPAAKGLDRSLSCRLTDLGQVVQARLAEGEIKDMQPVPDDPALPPADIRLTMSSDDLLALTDGDLSFASAWASGRVKLEAGLRDMLKLRSLL
jgi:hypothetical protein